jgi:hypothetical protein
LDHILIDETGAEPAAIGMADEEDANNRDTVINECANSPLDMMPPDESGALPPGPKTDGFPVEIEDESDSGDMHEGEPNRDEKGIPTEFIYTLRDNATTKRLRPQMLTKMIHTAEQTRDKLKKEMTKATVTVVDQGVFAPRRKIWEVYVGRERVSECLRRRGDIDVEIFSYQTGWDFDKASDRARFLKKLKEEEPDEVLITPACKLWSSLQELSASRSEEARNELIKKRQ